MRIRRNVPIKLKIKCFGFTESWIENDEYLAFPFVKVSNNKKENQGITWRKKYVFSKDQFSPKKYESYPEMLGLSIFQGQIQRRGQLYGPKPNFPITPPEQQPGT